MTFTSFLTFKAQLHALKVQLKSRIDEHELALATDARIAASGCLVGGQVYTEIIKAEMVKLEKSIKAIETLIENLPQDQKPYLTP